MSAMRRVDTQMISVEWTDNRTIRIRANGGTLDLLPDEWVDLVDVALMLARRAEAHEG